jgi:hypothetical protein
MFSPMRKVLFVALLLAACGAPDHETKVTAVFDAMERLALGQVAPGKTPDEIVDLVRDEAAKEKGYGSFREFAAESGRWNHSRYTEITARREQEIRKRVAEALSHR